MKRLIIAFFLIIPNLTYSQIIPDTIKRTADSILVENSSKELFEKVFKYNCLESATFINHTSWHECDTFTKKQKRFFRKQNKKYNIEFYEIRYDIMLLDTIPAFVKIELNEKGELIRIDGIPQKENINLLIELSVTKKEAKEIAIRNGFKKGLTSWEIHLVFEVNNEGQGEYKWEIMNTIDSGDSRGNGAHGEILYINANDGGVMREIIWEAG